MHSDTGLLAGNWITRSYTHQWFNPLMSLLLGVLSGGGLLVGGGESLWRDPEGCRLVSTPLSPQLYLLFPLSLSASDHREENSFTLPSPLP